MKAVSIHYDLRENVDAAGREAVNTLLREHNERANPEFMSAWRDPANDPRPLCVLATDSEGVVIGGLLGETQFRWLKITVLAVRPGRRGAGVGTRLVRLAEREAVGRGCRYAYADTMGHQAPGFFQKIGFQTAGLLEDWDSHGHAKHLMTRWLSDAGA